MPDTITRTTLTATTLAQIYRAAGSLGELSREWVGTLRDRNALDPAEYHAVQEAYLFRQAQFLGGMTYGWNGG